MLRDLAENEVTQLLGLVAEVEHSPVLADHTQHLLSDMDYQLCLDYCVVTSGDYGNLRSIPLLFILLATLTDEQVGEERVDQWEVSRGSLNSLASVSSTKMVRNLQVGG